MLSHHSITWNLRTVCRAFMLNDFSESQQERDGNWYTSEKVPAGSLMIGNTNATMFDSFLELAYSTPKL